MSLARRQRLSASAPMRGECCAQGEGQGRVWAGGPDSSGAVSRPSSRRVRSPPSPSSRWRGATRSCRAQRAAETLRRRPPRSRPAARGRAGRWPEDLASGPRPRARADRSARSPGSAARRPSVSRAPRRPTSRGRSSRRRRAWPPRWAAPVRPHPRLAPRARRPSSPGSVARSARRTRASSRRARCSEQSARRGAWPTGHRPGRRPRRAESSGRASPECRFVRARAGRARRCLWAACNARAPRPSKGRPRCRSRT
jgi:hypothetical protein